MLCLSVAAFYGSIILEPFSNFTFLFMMSSSWTVIMSWPLQIIITMPCLLLSMTSSWQIQIIMYIIIMSHCQSKFNLITLSYVPTYLNSNYLGFKFGLPLHLAIGLIWYKFIRRVTVWCLVQILQGDHAVLTLAAFVKVFDGDFTVLALVHWLV